MRALTLVLLVSLGLPVTFAGEPTAPGAATAPPAEAKPAADRLKENPNDTAAFDEYLTENLRRVATVMDADPVAAERQLGQVKQVLESLKLDTPAAQQALTRARAIIGRYEQQLKIARMSLEEIGKGLQANPDDTKTLGMFLAKVQRQVGRLTRSEPDKAEAELKAAQELLAKVRAEAREEAAKKQYEQAERTFGYLQKSIATAKRQAALIGQDAAPLGVEAWVNGSALTDADLKGKVVLLDFWAVWCGPCIATFPHLREWNEKYADKGLMIIGLTRYYGLVWDEQQHRATPPKAKPKPALEPGTTPPATAPTEPPAKPTPALEQEMLVKFAEQHQLHHRFAIQSGNALGEYYAVAGIPHVVVIDRQGKVRLIRVGSGEKNAQDIAALLAKLMDEDSGAK